MQDAEEQQPQDTKPVSSSHRRHPAPKIDPLLREVPPGGRAAPIQGLDWFRNSLLEDADGDCATDFLEEPQPEPSDNRGPAPKKLHKAALQSFKGKASPARVSGLTVEKGNVTSSEENPTFYSSATRSKRNR